FGQMIIIAAALADIISIILFTFTAFVIEHGFKIEILFIILLFAVFYIFYRIGGRITQINLFKKILFQLSHAASQIKVRGTILVILVFVVIAQNIGKEVVLLGAFLAGILLSMFLHKGRSLLIIKLDGMGYGFFIPIFFIMVGAQFDPSALQEFDNSLWLFLIFLVITLYGVKIIPAFFWVRLFGIKRAVTGGVLLASRLSLIIAASKIGLDLGIITPGINACFIIMAVVTCFLSPILYNHFSPDSKTTGDRVIIVGGSSTAVLLARRLKINEKKSIIIERKYARVKEILGKGLDAVHGDGRNFRVYERLGMKSSNYVVALTESEEKNLKICQLVRNKLQHERVITQASSSSFENKLRQLEVEYLDKRRVIASTIENLILRPTTYHALIESFENYTLADIKVTNPKIDGQKVKDIIFHQDGSLMLLKRGNEMEVPHGDTYLYLGDILTIIGSETAIA
ncbi:MAG: cation:proton antiporter, partial [Cyclobacteriaceae bacterium]|nr:cation:proton antiporter [Cyclobacteriaceae bacterium]